VAHGAHKAANRDLKHAATHWHTLHRTKTRCNLLQHTATHGNTSGIREVAHGAQGGKEGPYRFCGGT